MQIHKAVSTATCVGDYRLVDFVGAGGMGRVYRGIHVKIGRVAAIKVMTQAEHDGVQRFLNEARIHSSLNHPGIATLYDYLEFDGQPCIIMEYVDGVTLAEHVKRSGQLPVLEAVAIFRAVVEAVAYIHGFGVLHRDIKSNNIKISSSGQVKLLDFGIAKSQTTPGLTASGAVVGTIEYLSPEQIMGGSADPRSDIWALGVLLYEMVTGHVPFVSSSFGELCNKVVRLAPKFPAQSNTHVSPQLQAVIMRCLRKNPADRYQTAGELLREIDDLQVPTDENDSVTKWWQKQWAKLTAGSAAAAVTVSVLFLIAAAGLASREEKRKPPSPPAAATPHGEIVLLKAAPDETQNRSYWIKMSDGESKIYHDGNLIGRTPCHLKSQVGENIKLVLVREGYEAQKESFTVTENRRNYDYVMTTRKSK